MLRADIDGGKRGSMPDAVNEGTRKALLDAGQAGLNRSLAEVPHGATSGLAQSAFGPEAQDDGSVIWGFTAEYARHVEEGTDPHWAPIDPLKRWVRRVLGEPERVAYAVQKKIAEEGTEPQPYVRPGIDATKAFLRQARLGEYIEDEL